MQVLLAPTPLATLDHALVSLDAAGEALLTGGDTLALRPLRDARAATGRVADVIGTGALLDADAGARLVRAMECMGDAEVAVQALADLRRGRPGPAPDVDSRARTELLLKLKSSFDDVAAVHYRLQLGEQRSPGGGCAAAVQRLARISAALRASSRSPG